MTSMFWPALGGALIASGVWFGIMAHDADAASRDIVTNGPTSEDSPAILARDTINHNTVIRVQYRDGLHCTIMSGAVWCGWKP